MRTLRGTLLALAAALGAVGLAGLVEIGCGDDTSGSRLESVPDATADGRALREAGSSADTSTDGGPDVREDVETDAGAPGLAFAIGEATAICSKLLNCCPDAMDGGTYDLQRCIATTVNTGWEESLPRDPRVYSRGHIRLDGSKVSSCLSALGSLPCGMQTSAQWGAVTSACELMIQGTMPSGLAGCISSFECAPGNYCDPTVDGGMCTPLATQGQPCNTKISDPTLGDNPLADEMCSYLSSGQPALFCDLINNGPDAATCQPLLSNGSSCSNAANGYYDDQACKPPALCGDNLRCGGTTSYPYPNFCQSYRVQDAGPG